MFVKDVTAEFKLASSLFGDADIKYNDTRTTFKYVDVIFYDNLIINYEIFVCVCLRKNTIIYQFYVKFQISDFRSRY